MPDDDDYGDNDIPKTDHELAIYHYSHSRGQEILARIERMLACRDTGAYMFHAREGIRHLRMARMATESDPKLMELFDKYFLVAGALSSDENRKLSEGVDLVPSPFDPFEGEGLCRGCRNLNLRRDTFRVGSSNISSIMGHLSPDIEYSDEELEKKLPYNTSSNATRHYKLGDVQDIAKRSECSFCRLVADCFLRLSPEEITACGFEVGDIHGWCFDGNVWLSLLCDPVGDRPENELSHNRDETQTEDSLNPPGALTPTGRTRIILSILPQDNEPTNSKFRPPFDFLHTEMLPSTERDDAHFQVCKWSMPFIDVSRPLKWLNACEKHHGETCSAPGNHGNMEVHEDMLLIDLKDECLVSGFQGRRYFVLSYVWGRTQQITFQTTKATYNDLEKPGGLSIHTDEIANTILDAMKLTWDMECRYLWVDALCIIQDDDEGSKPFQINHMDAIYRQAILTIVAADNLSATDGISGVGTSPRMNFQRTYLYRPDLTLTAKEAVMGDIEVEVMQSNWASRAWTFQERIFSRRLLVFVNSTVYWSCSCLRWSETELNPSEDGPPPWDYYNQPVFRDNPTLYLKGLELPGDNSINFIWQNVVYTFSELKLSFEKDVFHAIAGLENYVGQYFDTAFIFGHPQKNFLDSLLWLPFNWKLRRRDAAGIRIPSWSWASWVGLLKYPEVQPHQRKYPKLRITPPTWKNISNSRVSISCPHSGVLDIHTMVSKVRVVGSMRKREETPECPEVGYVGPVAMRLAVLNQAGKCVGRACISLVEDFDGEVEAIIVAKKLPDVKKDSRVLLSHWIMIIEWKGDVAERIGLGVITDEAWQETGPVWRDIKLG